MDRLQFLRVVSGAAVGGLLYSLPANAKAVKSSSKTAAFITSKQALAGCDGVIVDCEKLNADDSITQILTSRNVTADIIRQDAEVLLRGQGIKVIDNGNIRPLSIVLKMSLDVLKIETDPLTCFYFTLNASQWTPLFRDKTEISLVSIWSHGQLFYLGDEKLENVRDNAKDMLGTFISDYLKANPKQ